ncbi:hydrogenase maturation protease [Desulfohalobium retbaense]|uniref:Hydrogenase maturation protease n=1 Tax=Desulfohalobium retbaense (strain ATCC 49708 / DSM 5692 / JCM 16813 / HR100) TaxID=485915 RepID=C8X544_DESRD|nr:hydrogenase maturation protease [Desulfohalobium retbaense]ACV69541.1 hydrogenase maturation protease [Desulfohalobium retbaense DSM 5692]
MEHRPAAMPEISVQVLCLGNTLLRDDGVGWEVAALLQDRLDPGSATITWGGTGGDALLDLLQPCRHLVVVDALDCGLPPGSVHELGVHDLDRMPTPRLKSSHGLDLGLVLELYRTLYSCRWPEEVLIVGIQIQEMCFFGEGCAPAVLQGAREASERIATQIQRWTRPSEARNSRAHGV